MTFEIECNYKKAAQTEIFIFAYFAYFLTSWLQVFQQTNYQG